MSYKKTLVVLTITAFLSLVTSLVSAQRMAPDDIEDFITDQLQTTNTSDLLSSDEDPSLLDIEIEEVENVDYVVVAEGLSANEVTTVLQDILERLTHADDVCDVEYVIDYDSANQAFTLIIYIDYCSQ
jgi:hypothetical protein